MTNDWIRAPRRGEQLTISSGVLKPPPGVYYQPTKRPAPRHVRRNRRRSRIIDIILLTLALLLVLGGMIAMTVELTHHKANHSPGLVRVTILTPSNPTYRKV